jgi:hypothetical protein
MNPRNVIAGLITIVATIPLGVAIYLVDKHFDFSLKKCECSQIVACECISDIGPEPRFHVLAIAVSTILLVTMILFRRRSSHLLQIVLTLSGLTIAIVNLLLIGRIVVL